MCLLLLVYVLAGVLHSEDKACLSRTTLVEVSDTNGEPHESLTAADFKATVGGKAASVQSATPANRPPRIIILVDASANHDQATWAATQAMLDEFLAGFPDVADFTLLTFDEKVQRVIHETNRAALQGTVGEMFPSGKKESEAGLADAVKNGSASLEPHSQGDAEFLVTTSDQIRKDTEQALGQQTVAGVRFFGASFDPSRRRGPTSFGAATVEDYSPLEAATRASGGLWIWFDMSRQDATTSLQSARVAGKRAAMLVRDYFTLDLRLAKPLAKAEKLKIELIKSPRIDPKDISTSYPQELFPCQ
jgi:hypothetical protein